MTYPRPSGPWLEWPPEEKLRACINPQVLHPDPRGTGLINAALDELVARADAAVAEAESLRQGLDLAIAGHWNLCGGCEHCNPARARLAAADATQEPNG